ncbi:hypothetical protein A2311_03655 [candidate division WOR-1 bacterium RIFOXYB2_FULL_48_7]|uniref:Uncharacterized protein n=1 Tax=candidate division WOR-1 bacterium RIFOXYB2_FULL_48_7 TaxID=1802583 RepID=A0A1F4TSN7_UNCSA|nr:MAG: hypothetical protein A2311_03655 [candidate division WOR-1 bacterium RIFOXYB2_FULL_48_7]
MKPFSLIISLIFVILLTPCLAMGSKPKPAEPKYKLEILKMEFVTAPATSEVKKHAPTVHKR